MFSPQNCFSNHINFFHISNRMHALSRIWCENDQHSILCVYSSLLLNLELDNIFLRRVTWPCAHRRNIFLPLKSSIEEHMILEQEHGICLCPYNTYLSCSFPNFLSLQSYYWLLAEKTIHALCAYVIWCDPHRAVHKIWLLTYMELQRLIRSIHWRH